MSSETGMRWVGLVAVVACAAGCSMGTFSYQECATNEQCRGAFGWGHVCREGLCASATADARCTETWPPNLYQRQAEMQDAILIGIQFDRSDFDLEMKAARLAVMQVMENEGLDGVEYALIECTNEENTKFDDLSQDEANEWVSEYLANEIGVAAIVGPATSNRVDSAYFAVKPYGTLTMSPTATSPALTELDGLTSTDAEPGLLWRTAPPDDLQGAVLAEYIANEGTEDGDDKPALKTIDVIFEEGPYGTALAFVFSEEFRARGGTTDLLGFGDADKRDEQLINASTSSSSGVLFISSDKDDTKKFLKQVATLDGLDEDRWIFLADGGKDTAIFDEVAALSREDLERIRGTAPAPDGGLIYLKFAKAFSSRFGSDAGETPYTPYAYDAAWLVLYGTAWSHFNEGAISGLGIARGLRQVSQGDQVDVDPTTWNSVVAHFKDGISVNVAGASGELDYDPETGETSAPIEVWTVEREDGVYSFGSLKIYDPTSLD